MVKIRVAIGSENGVDIDNSHLGDIARFYLYDIDKDGNIEPVEYRDNPYQKMDHAGDNKMNKILSILKDVHVLIARQKSPNFRRIASKTKYQPVIIKKTSVDKSLETVARNFKEIKALVDKRTAKEISEEIPTYE